MIVLDGKLTSAKIRAELAEKVKALKAAGKKVPHLAAILVGEDGASNGTPPSCARSAAVATRICAALSSESQTSTECILKSAEVGW